MDALLENLVINIPDFKQPRRIIYSNQALNIVAHIDVHAKGASPVIEAHSDLQALLDDGQLTLVEDPHTKIFFESDLSDVMKDRKDRAWRAIAPLVKELPQILYSSNRQKRIAARALEEKVHEDTIRNWMVEYWQRGLAPTVLYGRRKNCGAPGQRKTPKQPDANADDGTTTEAKRGTPRTSVPGVGININRATRRLIKAAVTQHFVGKRNGTLKHAYNMMLLQNFPEAVKVTKNSSGRVKVDITDPDKVPMYQQFLYWRKAELDEFQEKRARLGKTFFNRTMRPLIADSTVEAIGPGYRYQIDATIADVYLVSRIDRKTLIGRPVVYVVIDVFSRLVVGLYIGLEHPSWPTAMMAIHNITEDKVKYCKQFGIHIEPNEWPNSSLASVILGDKGEMISKAAERMTEVLGNDVENAPAYRPDWKGIVERMFRTIQEKLAPEMPAYVAKDFKTRTGHDYRQDGTLTLEDFTKLVIHGVIAHNNSLISGYPLDNQMIAENVQAIPTELWAWGIKNRMGRMISHSPEKISFALLPSDDATVTSKGIKFHGRYYQTADGSERAWSQTKARVHGTYEIRVSYHPHNLDKIYVHNPMYTDRFSVALLKSEDKSALALYVEEVLQTIKTASKGKGKIYFQQLGVELTRTLAVQEIIANAKKAKANLGPDERSKKEKASGINAARKAEKYLDRIGDSITSMSADTPSQSKAPSPPRTTPAAKPSIVPLFLHELTDDE